MKKKQKKGKRGIEIKMKKTAVTQSESERGR